MMKHTLFTLIALALIALPVLPLVAQQDDAKPTLNPTEEKKKDPFGMGMLSKDRPKDAKTDITANIQATFDNSTSIAEFEGNVVVKDPQFTLFCDKLKVFLSKDRKGMDRAEATGKVVIVQENTDEGGKVTKSIGRAGMVVFYPKTGDIVLTIWPSMEHGASRQVATDEKTVMRLNRSGKSQTDGRSRTEIIGGDPGTP